MRKTTFVATLGLLSLSSCRSVFDSGVPGNGSVVSQQRLISADFESIEMYGGASLAILGVDSESLAVNCSGALSGTIQGRATECELGARGSVELDLNELLVREIRVDISGACDVPVNVEIKLDVNVSGAASVGYLGEPSVELSRSGSARVNAIEG